MTSNPLLANPQAIARRVIVQTMPPAPPIDLNQWAEQNVVFGSESPFPGPYDGRRFPFFNRILEVLSPEHSATIVVIRKSAQLGGTVLAQIFAAAILHRAPQPVLYVHPSDSNARRWKAHKFSKMVVASPMLRRIMQPEGAAGNSSLYWSRRDGRGYIQLAGSNSPAQLSMDSYPIAIHDDLAKWVGDNGAGDPETQADSRSKAFVSSGAKILKIGTPATEPGCRITRAWRLGTREKWHVPCPTCGVEQHLEWANMLACLDEANPDDAHFTCVGCGGRIDERHKQAMNARGRWVAEAPGAEIASFYLWAAYSPLETWANIAKAWLRARGSSEAERVFLNDTVGEAYQTATSAPSWEGLRDRAEAAGLPRGVIPPGMLIVTIGCDCQVDRVEWQCVAWGPRLQRTIIDCEVIRHPIADEAAHRELDALLARTWPDTFGNRRPLDMLAIDGGNWANDVFAWVRRAKSSRIMVVRGSRVDTAPPLALVKHERRPDGKLIRAQRRWFNVGVSGLKASLYQYLRKDDPLEMGHIGFVAGLEDEFFRQLTSEVRRSFRRRDGSTEWRWTALTGLCQEMLDAHIYASAAALRCGWTAKSDEQWERLRAELEVTPEPDLPLLNRLNDKPASPPPAILPSTIRSSWLADG